ncbi:ATP-binding cassette domain-containing protein [Actinoplanes sp. NPDC051851]|uniref:ATP-binding cassette domain-containing protein n=1 Tax=Actinoplanes sp. NPDC051851 TaxID=3154753 RepID=UPI003420094D
MTADRLRKSYPGGVTALDGLSLDVRAGEVFGLLGPNGAGKSTTVKILTTPARPDAGQATVAGHDVLRHPERARSAIGVVAQRSALDPMASDRDNFTLQGRPFGVRGKALDLRVEELPERPVPRHRQGHLPTSVARVFGLCPLRAPGVPLAYPKSVP